jgi:hypothetical protein
MENEFLPEDMALTKEQLSWDLPANIRGLDIAIKSNDQLRLLNAAMAVVKCYKKIMELIPDTGKHE